jgi:CheY-like chemotaxis protein
VSTAWLKGENRVQPKPSVALRVLVVDDHRASRQFVTAALRQTGASVKAARGVREAVDRLHDWWPDAVLCDWNLEDGKGSDVAALLNQSRPPGAPRPRMVLLSGEQRDDLAHRDFDLLLSKPCAREHLLDALGCQPGLAVLESRPTDDDLVHAIRDEFARRMPRIEGLILNGRLREAAEIAHQLTASGALAGDKSLRQAMDSLHDALRGVRGAEVIAARWLRASAAVEDYLGLRDPA